MKPRRFIEEFLALVRKYGLEQYCPELYYAIRDAERGAMSESRARYYFYRAEEFVAGLRHRPVHLFEAPETQEDLYESRLPDVELGVLFRAREIRFGFNYQLIPRSCLVIGGAGQGKSTLVRALLAQLTHFQRRIKRRISVILFDGKGHGFSDVPALCGDDWIVVNVASAPCLGLNGPASVPVHTWITRVAKTFAAAFGLVAGADVLARLITWCVEQLNPDGGTPVRYPDIAMLIRVLRAISHCVSEKQIYAQALLQKLCEMERAAPDAFRTFGGLDINALIAQGKSVVIDFSGIDSEEIRTFITGVISSAVLLDRQERGHLVDGLEVLVVRDDADHAVSADLARCFGAHGSPLEEFAELGREMGLAVLVSVHSLVGIARGIAANCPTVMVFGLADADSMSIARRYLFLNPEQACLLPALRVGECLFRQSDSLWPLPLLGCVDHIPPNRSTQPPVYTVPECIPAKLLDEMPEILQEVEALRRPARKSAGAAPPVVRPQLSVLARQLLDLATLHPTAPLYFLWRQFHQEPSASAQLHARRQLEKLELVECEEMRIGRTAVMLLRVTGGWAYLDKQPTGTEGSGSLSHVRCQHWIAGAYRKRGCRADIEATIPGTSHRTDVLLQLPDGRSAVEVVHACDANLLSHLANCLLVSSSIARVMVVAREKKELARLQEMVDAEPSLELVRSRISFETIEPYMRELYG